MNRTYRSVWNEALGARRAGMTAAVLLLVAGAASAQVKIGDNPITINPGSMLEVEATDRGVSMPRIAVTDRVTWGLRGNVPVEGMMVYNTNATTGVNGLQAGMAVWKNGQWISVDETPYMHVNSTQVGNSTLANSGATGANAIAVGPNAIASGADSTALGQGASATAAQGVAIGAGSSVVQVGGVALGAGSVASTAAGVAGYVPPGASAAQTAAVIGTTSTQAAVSVGDAANGQYRQINGVAAGTVDSDAVNVSQLKSTAGSLNNRIDNLADQISSNTRMLSGGIAASAAMAVVTPVEPGRYHVSGAVAGYNGQAGIGFNVLKRSDNGQTTLHAGVGWGSGGSKAIVRVGFGFSFD